MRRILIALAWMALSTACDASTSWGKDATSSPLAFSLSPEAPRLEWRVAVDGNNPAFEDGSVVVNGFYLRVAAYADVDPGVVVPTRCTLRQDGHELPYVEEFSGTSNCTVSGFWRLDPCGAAADCSGTIIAAVELVEGEARDFTLTAYAALSGPGETDADALQLSIDVAPVQ